MLSKRLQCLAKETRGSKTKAVVTKDQAQRKKIRKDAAKGQVNILWNLIP